MGTPISPAFSMIEIASFAQKAITAASRTIVVLSRMSSLAAIRTISRITPFRISPLKPALLSSRPDSLFFDAWKTPATSRPVI